MLEHGLLITVISGKIYLSMLVHMYESNYM